MLSLSHAMDAKAERNPKHDEVGKVPTGESCKDEIMANKFVDKGSSEATAR